VIDQRQLEADSLPAAIHAEIAILGCMLLDALAISDATARLTADDFALDSHRKVYRSIVDLIAKGHGVDYTTVRAELERRREMDAVGGPAWLASLTEGIPRNFNIESYVRIVKDKSLLRQLMAICHDAETRAGDQSEDAVAVLADLEERLAEVADASITHGLTDIAEIVATSFGSIDAFCGERREVTGVRTHFSEFDRMTGGLQSGELTIIAARPSMGKTAWAINIAQNAAVQDGMVVAVFSLEMSKESLLKRMVASEARVNSRKIDTGFTSREDRARIVAGLEQLMTSKLHIDDTASISLMELRAKARRLKQREGKLDLIVIDYLQLMGAGKKKTENRTQEVSAISRGVKALAKELKVPVVALSQLSRGSEQRAGDKKPLLSDLRESGSIEQDADVVAFIHRPEYYDRENMDLRGKAEVIIAKQRNGPTGTVNLMCNLEMCRFEDGEQERETATQESWFDRVGY
jgi:replicative DNA helicase